MRGLVVGAMCLLAGVTAEAQVGPRVGYAGTPNASHTPSPPPQRPAPSPAPVVVYTNPGSASDTYIVNGAPYLVLNDGTVMVNFGNGYERILRQCTTGAPAASQTDKNGLDAMGRLPLPLLNPLSGGERGQVLGTMPARNEWACFRVTKHRRVQIVKS